jgi:hypothetical protein
MNPAIDTASRLAARTRVARAALTAADRSRTPLPVAERQRLIRALEAAKAAEDDYWTNR